jgi:hypothetical protein
VTVRERMRQPAAFPQPQAQGVGGIPETDPTGNPKLNRDREGADPGRGRSQTSLPDTRNRAATVTERSAPYPKPTRLETRN